MSPITWYLLLVWRSDKLSDNRIDKLRDVVSKAAGDYVLVDHHRLVQHCGPRIGHVFHNRPITRRLPTFGQLRAQKDLRAVAQRAQGFACRLKFLKEGQHGWVGAQLIRIRGAPGHIDGIVVLDCGLFDARINWNPAGILGELDGQNMRLSYLWELGAERRRIFYVIGRDEMADGAAPRAISAESKLRFL